MNVEERFWPKVDKTGDCWTWTARVRNGYGLFQIGGIGQSAHRVSYELAHGPIPEGMQVDHTCHNRACVNPDHLRLVTHAQNHTKRTVGGASATRRQEPSPRLFRHRRGSRDHLCLAA